MANTYVNHGGYGGRWGDPVPFQAVASKKFHAGYYYALVYSDPRTLTAAVTSTTTTLALASTGQYASNGVVWVDNERITYTGKTGTTLTGCTRGTGGTAATSHAVGAYVKLYKTVEKLLSNYTVARSELNTHSSLRGCLVRYCWRNIEVSEGVYDFTEADAILADMKDSTIMTNGLKRMCFMIELRNEDADKYIVPDYVINNASSEGGQFQFTGSDPAKRGWYVRLWNAYTLSRFKLFLQALAAHYDSEPYFEMFQVSETSLGTPISPQPAGFSAAPADYHNRYYTGLKEATLALNAATPNTITCQLCNFGRADIQTLIPALVADGVAIGCPNSLADEPGLTNTGATPGIFSYFNTYKNQVPIVPAIQKPEMFYSNTTWNLTNYTTGVNPTTGAAPSGGVVPNPTFQVLTDFLKTAQLPSNYIFVTRVEFANGTSNITGNAFKDDFLTFMNLSAQSSTVTGGLNTTQPSKYTSVITT